MHKEKGFVLIQITSEFNLGAQYYFHFFLGNITMVTYTADLTCSVGGNVLDLRLIGMK